MRETAKRMRQTYQACGDIWFLRAAQDIERLATVAEAAGKMPRWTPKGGGASTKHTFQIAAADVWELDAALKELDQPLAARDGEEQTHTGD